MKIYPLGRLFLALSISGCGIICAMDQKDDNNLIVPNQIIPFSGFQSHEIKDFFSCVPGFLDLKALSSLSQINHFSRIICHPYKLEYFRNAPPFICPENEIIPILNSLRKIALHERFLYDVTILEDGIELKATDEDKLNFHTQNNPEITKALNYSNLFNYSIVFKNSGGAAYRNEISTRHKQLLQSGFLHGAESLFQSVRKDYVYKYGYATVLIGWFVLLASDAYTSRNQELYTCGFSQPSLNCMQFYGMAPANLLGYEYSQQGAIGCFPFALDAPFIDQIFDINCQTMKDAVLWKVSMGELVCFLEWAGFLLRYIQIFILR